jgi:hypothetical protein
MSRWTRRSSTRSRPSTRSSPRSRASSRIKCKDVLRFTALAETFTRFWVDYLKPSGAIGRYYLDRVVGQKTRDRDVNGIVETKGRVWEGTEQKDSAIRYWCTQVTDLVDEPWEYMRIDQPIFKPDTLKDYAALVALISKQGFAVSDLVLLSPA